MGDFTKHLWIRRFLKAPDGWNREEVLTDGARFGHKKESVRVLVSGTREKDGKRWLHLSISRPNRTPTIDELREVKFAFIGDLKAMQIFPSRDEYVNLHQHCLHLFACLDGDPLPDFRRGIGSI